MITIATTWKRVDNEWERNRGRKDKY